jgi:hypothetical protein
MTRLFTITTFKSSADSIIMIIGNLLFSIIPQSYERWLLQCKKVCSRLNVPTAAKLQWSLSNPQRANQLTVKPAFQNADLRSQKVSARQTVSIRNKCGHGEERIGKETMRLAIILCSNGLTVYTTRKLFRKKQNKK